MFQDLLSKLLTESAAIMEGLDNLQMDQADFWVQLDKDENSQGVLQNAGAVCHGMHHDEELVGLIPVVPEALAMTTRLREISARLPEPLRQKLFGCEICGTAAQEDPVVPSIDRPELPTLDIFHTGDDIVHYLHELYEWLHDMWEDLLPDQAALRQERMTKLVEPERYLFADLKQMSQVVAALQRLAQLRDNWKQLCENEGHAWDSLRISIVRYRFLTEVSELYQKICVPPENDQGPLHLFQFLARLAS